MDIEDIDLETRAIVLRNTKRKVRKGGESVQEARTTSFLEDTRVKILEHLEDPGNSSRRKTGPLFLSRKGGRLSGRAVQKMIHSYAVKAGLQRVVGYTTAGKPRYLITPKAFREAGEAYTIEGGMPREKAATRAGHSLKVQQRNYDKYLDVRARDMVDRALPRIEI